MPVIADEADYEKEANALRQLRTYLERLAIRTKSSVGDNEFFYAFLTEENGYPADGLFITVRGDDFSWSRDGKHPMADIEGAAHTIEGVIREQAADRESQGSLSGGGE